MLALAGGALCDVRPLGHAQAKGSVVGRALWVRNGRRHHCCSKEERTKDRVAHDNHSGGVGGLLWLLFCIRQFQPNNRIRPKAFPAGHQYGDRTALLRSKAFLTFPLVATRVSTFAFVYRLVKTPREMGCLLCVVCKSSSWFRQGRLRWRPLPGSA